MNDKNLYIERLRSTIEETLGNKIRTPRDFVNLSKAILARQHIHISPTTLKRLWGYLKENTTTRTSTLDILSRFIGYKDWNDFCQNFYSIDIEMQEHAIINRKISTDELKAGQIIEINCYPNKYWMLAYTGNNSFRIIQSQNSKLDSGDTFSCYMFIEGEPLYIDKLLHKNFSPATYIIGTRGGITFNTVKVIDNYEQDNIQEGIKDK